MLPMAVTLEECGGWLIPLNKAALRPRRDWHSMKWSNGREWDAVNGWRS